MNQKVKLQVSCELVDVPSFSGTMLGEATNDLEKLQNLLLNIVDSLRGNAMSSEEEVNKLQKSVVEMELARILLMKIDSRLGDTASIISGLHEALTKPAAEPVAEENKEAEKNVNVSAG